MKPNDLKILVKEKYGEIASQSKYQNQSSCCGSTGCCDEVDYSIFSEDYTDLKGYNADADLAGINAGDHVLDLGSGAGNDCFVARTIVGETGRVTGIDFTEEMLLKANENLKKTGYKNIEFIRGDIEDIPISDNSIDVVISNCVLNLVPDKKQAYSEILRVLKPGGHFCISDVVVTGNLPQKLREAAEMYAGCVSGALLKDEYMEIINQLGFKNVIINKENEVEIPDNILLSYIKREDIDIMKRNKIGIFSITVSGTK